MTSSEMNYSRRAKRQASKECILRAQEMNFVYFYTCKCIFTRASVSGWLQIATTCLISSFRTLFRPENQAGKLVFNDMLFWQNSYLDFD